jgi:hypothetical protein
MAIKQVPQAEKKRHESCAISKCKMAGKSGGAFAPQRNGIMPI